MATPNDGNPTSFMNAYNTELAGNPASKMSDENDPALVPDSKLIAIVQALAAHKNIPYARAVQALAVILQKGGCAKRANPDIYVVLDGGTITLGDIRFVLASMTGRVPTLRQIARSMATMIYHVCANYGIPGNLYKKIIRNTDASTISVDKEWFSDFQMENPDCPLQARDILRKHYLELFPNKKI